MGNDNTVYEAPDLLVFSLFDIVLRALDDDGCLYHFLRRETPFFFLFSSSFQIMSFRSITFGTVLFPVSHAVSARLAGCFLGRGACIRYGNLV